MTLRRMHRLPGGRLLAPPADTGSDPLWYKDAVIYQVHVKAFRDSNGDGVGDFGGLTEGLPYIRDLGVNTIWLLPFYPSPLRDDGYDIADYHGVHPQYGTLADFRHFLKEAHALGLRVITELVINHTSDQHPWFQAARRAPPGSAKRNYYVWNDDDQRWPETRIIFTDTEKSNWTFDPVAKQYFWHRFFSHQPDLNFDNPNVVRAVVRVMRYWLDMGVDGMRLDAIPYLCERDGTINENLPPTHAVLKHMRAELDRSYADRFFLAEVNQWPEDVRPYFGNGDECHMAFHFPLMPRIYMALAEEDRHAITDIMGQTPEIPDNCQWAIFLRNHDELTLEMVTERERDYLYRTYAADRQMRINLGIRRRLAPLMDNDRRKIELLNSLLMSLIGSPVVYYGDEIGMGDNIYLGDRNGVRTPMQWTSDRNAGFSRAVPQRLFLPPIMDEVYGYAAVNVEAQERSSASLLNWMKRLIAARRAHRSLSRGTLRFVRPGNRKVLAYVRELNDEAILCVANLARTSQPAELDLAAWKGRTPVELLGNTPFPPIGELPYFVTLPGYGFYWFRLEAATAAPEWHVDRGVPEELPVLVIPDGLMAALSAGGDAPDVSALLARRVREQLERDVLPRILPAQRWYAANGHAMRSVALHGRGEWKPPGGEWLLTLADVQLDDGTTQAYSLPLALAWETGDGSALAALLPSALARVRQRARVGILYDAFRDDAFVRAMVAAMVRADRTPVAGGELRYEPTRRLTALADVPAAPYLAEPLRHPPYEQVNTLVVFGESLLLKGYRRLRPGLNPEIEMGRFLTDVSPFANAAPLLGSLEHVAATGERTALAVLFGYVGNEGNGWDYTQGHLRRLAEDALARGNAPADDPALTTGLEHGTLRDGFLALMATLGGRTAELHAALAFRSGDPAFDPEPFTAADVEALRGKLAQDFDVALALLAERSATLPPGLAPVAEHILGQRVRLRERALGLVPATIDGLRTRHHGDFHLVQVLLIRHDFAIVGFEGDPARPVAERRAKHSPLRDVAGMLRSFRYAADYAARHGPAHTEAERARVAVPLEHWRVDATAAFLAGYRERGAGVASLPSAAVSERLVAAFVLEGALHELRDALLLRPTWAGVPLAILLELQDPATGTPP